MENAPGEDGRSVVETPLLLLQIDGEAEVGRVQPAF
jgi:hypothetical protein